MKKTILRQLRKGFHDVFYIWRREMKNVFKDQGVLIFFFLVPLAYPILYAFIYTNETVREVPVVAVDMSHSSLSRKFLHYVDASPDLHIIAYCTNMEEGKDIMRHKDAYGIVYMPEHFSNDIAKGEQTEVEIFCDMSGLLYYKAMLSTCTDVSLKMNEQIKISRMGNSTHREDEVGTQPIRYESVALFNPQNGFAAFVLPAVLILIIQQTLLLGIGLSAGTARENNLLHDLVPRDKHYYGTLRIVLGKSLVYFTIYLLMGTYVLCAVPKMFSLVQIAQPIVLFTFLIPYLSACIFFAMTASIAIRNRETCMLIFVFTSVPLLFLSGISWPGASIPTFWKYFSYLFPSTFGINGFVKINSMGAGLHEVLFEYQALWMQTGIYFITTCWVYRHQILVSRRHTLSDF